MLARRVRDIFVGRGLVQHRYSIGGGRDLHVPQVISVTAEPPVGLEIRALPSQTPGTSWARIRRLSSRCGTGCCA